VLADEDEQLGAAIGELGAIDGEVAAYPRRDRLGQPAKHMQRCELAPRPDAQNRRRPVELLRLPDDEGDERLRGIGSTGTEHWRGQ